ncbi:MAG: metallophosphoesterase [bacterium]|nr:metallophosphoesterase [bacterium]
MNNREIDRQKELIKRIKLGYSSEALCYEFGVNLRGLQKLLLELKNSGIPWQKIYNANGEFNVELDSQHFFDGTRINLAPDASFKALVVSDLHLAAEKEGLGILNMFYDYCAKQGINFIVNCGDLINGSSIRRVSTISNSYQQVEYLVEKYPYDEAITNIVILGNHDINGFSDNGKYYLQRLAKRRPDFSVSGIGTGNISLLQDNILLYHPLTNKDRTIPEASLVLLGHSHNYKVDLRKKNCTRVYVPALCKSIPSRVGTLPSGLLMECFFNSKGKIEVVNLEQLTFLNDKLYSLSKQELALKRRLTI